MIPLVEDIWPKVKERLPGARLTIIGGYYRFREGSKPDDQERTVEGLSSRQDLKDLDITFTGVISQKEIADILANAWMMLYPGAFPETFGISSLESLLYKTPLVTTRFGALEETAIEQACYLIDYAIEPNGLFPHVNKDEQVNKFLDAFFDAYSNSYLHQQKQNYCGVIKDIVGWDAIALQWKQFLYSITDNFLPVDQYRKVTRINDKVTRIFGRTSNMPARKEYRSFMPERRIVLVSTFRNAQDYLKKHMESVYTQDYENYLHLLIDDNSDDNSIKVVYDELKELPEKLREKIKIIFNDRRFGCIRNQLSAIRDFCDPDDIVMLLDGDDWLVNNNTIFQYYNDLYSQGYEFTYGSMWSVADNIPLIAQDYPKEVKLNRTYRKHLFNWKIPYTHLRTTLAEHFENINEEVFKTHNGEWMKSGADNPLFYELIEKIEPGKIYCNSEIVCHYNDANPLNDYKINGEEQTENANKSYGDKNRMKKILIAIPTNKNIEVETFKSMWNLEIPEGYEVDFEYSFGYRIDQVRNLISEWAKNYDYLFSVDSDIVLPSDSLKKMLSSDKDIVSGLYIQRIPGAHTLEVYMSTPGGGCTNIPYELIKGRGLVEVEACGMGCALIKSEVFRELEYPHFFYTSALNHSNTVSEDVYFCRKAKEAGFTVWADETIRCDHIGQWTFQVEKETLQRLEKTHLEKIAEMDLLPEAHSEYLTRMNIEPKVIYDLGACVLHWTRKAKEVWPDAKYHLVDGAKSVMPFLKNSGDEWQIAILGDKEGHEVDFYEDTENPGGNSYYKETTGAFTEEHKTKRKMHTLDHIREKNRWEYPDLVKLDVQGAELDILMGAKETLRNCTDIILEAQTENYNEGAPKADDVIKFMREIGYELVSTFCSGEADADYHFRRINRLSKIVNEKG